MIRSGRYICATCDKFYWFYTCDYFYAPYDWYPYCSKLNVSCITGLIEVTSNPATGPCIDHCDTGTFCIKPHIKPRLFASREEKVYGPGSKLKNMEGMIP